MKHKNVLLMAALPLALSALAACSATPPAPRTVASADATEVSLACEPVTGSRIRSARSANCNSASSPVKSFTAEELQATGEMDLNKALQTLDPSIR